jgi:arsenite-transporting ATPase
VLKQVQTLTFDVVVFDTAPTGHTLRLLQLPATLEKSLGKLMSMQSGLGGIFGSLMSMMGGPSDVSEESLFAKMQGLKRSVEEVNAQFRDPTLTTFVCVAAAEFLSLFESERLIQELARNDIDVHNIIVNQVLFPELAGGSRLLDARIRMQQVRRACTPCVGCEGWRWPQRLVRLGRHGELTAGLRGKQLRRVVLTRHTRRAALPVAVCRPL